MWATDLLFPNGSRAARFCRYDGRKRSSDVAFLIRKKEQLCRKLEFRGGPHFCSTGSLKRQSQLKIFETRASSCITPKPYLCMTAIMMAISTQFDLDDGPSRPRHTESMAFGSKPARFRSDNASISRRNAQTCSLFVCGSNRRCWYACLAVPRSSSDAQDLGSVARLVVTHVGDEGSRPGCNFCGITAAA